MDEQKIQNDESLFELEKKIYEFNGEKASTAMEAFDEAFSDDDLDGLEE